MFLSTKRGLKFEGLCYLRTQKASLGKKFKPLPLWNLQSLPVDSVWLPTEKRAPALESDKV